MRELDYTALTHIINIESYCLAMHKVNLLDLVDFGAHSTHLDLGPILQITYQHEIILNNDLRN